MPDRDVGNAQPLPMRLKPPPALVHALGTALAGRLRYRSHGVEHLRRAIALSPTGSVVFCLWHQSLLAVLGRHHGQRVAALTSLSSDGTIMADYIGRIGLRAIRGSSSRGGLKAARELMNAVEDGWHAAITVDGPRGPLKVVKAGPFEISRRTGAPIVPIGVRASAELSFKRAWDRFRVPLPGARVALVYGPPMVLPPEYPDAAQVFARRVALARQLHELEARAGALVGRRGQGPLPECLAWMRADAPPEVE
jgi:lysophospholipid acyltransferase (LPLAT)-like uncharacterized protein